ncbi:MAG: hypothetical protein K5757_11680 [Bacteroidaceae bacterium]|nr:hypothetical protein [Bacteroidaceae bacterium]
MWKETKVVKNVGHNNFDARYGAYATNESDGNSVINIAGKEFHTRKATRVRSYEDKVVVQTRGEIRSKDTLLYTKGGELLNVVNNTISLDDNTNMRYLNVYMRDGVNYNDYNNLVDIETGKVIFKEDYLGLRFVFKDMIFSNRDNIITRYDWDGSILWQHNYEPDFNVTIDLGFRLEGVCGGKLWVKSKHDRHEILLAIDVNTGELVKAFSDSEEDTNHEHCEMSIYNIIFKHDEDIVLNNCTVVYAIDANTLNVIDTFNPIEELERNTEEKVSFFIGDNLCGKYLTYLGEYPDDQTYSAFYIYNTETKRFEFSTRMFTPKERSRGRGWTNTHAIQYYGTGIICAHEGRDWLHIFEDVKE